MLEDKSNVDIISWGDEGNSFIVHDQARFSMEVLPKFYKHNNMASFVRQLNMYGFSKISHDPSHSALSSLKNPDANAVEFHHPQFLRGQPELVAQIKRKTTSSSANVPSNQLTTPANIQNLQNDPMAMRVLSDIQQLHKKHDSFNNQLEQLRHENEVLWREMAALRQKCQSQQNIISKVVNFLVSVIGGKGNGMGAMGAAAKRAFPMLGPHSSEEASETEGAPPKLSKLFSSTTGPTIQEIFEDEDLSPRPRAYSGDIGTSQPQTTPTANDEPPVRIVQLPPSVGTSTSSTKSPLPDKLTTRLVSFI